MRSRRNTAFVVAVSLGAANAAQAFTGSWAHPVDGDFADTANWSPALPGPADKATFGTGSGTSYAATISSVISVHSVELMDPQVTLDLVGGSLTSRTINTSARPSAFKWTGGSLNLTASSLLLTPDAATTVDPVNHNGALNVGSSLTLSAGMNLTLPPQSGPRYGLTIDDGTFDAVGSTIDVGGSVTVGRSGDGRLSLDKSASLVTNSTTFVGFYDSPTSRGAGTLSLDHGSSFTSTSTINVENEHGSIGVRGGALLSAESIHVYTFSTTPYAPPAAANSLTVAGTGSTLVTTGLLGIGYSGFPSLGAAMVSDGARVSSGSARIDAYLEMTSSVSLTGSGTTWTNAGSLVVTGYLAGSSTLSLSNHASLSTDSLAASLTAPTSSVPGSTAILSLSSGSSLDVVTSLSLGGATVPRGKATLSLTDSSASVGSSLTLFDTPGTSLQLNGSSTLTIGTAASPTATLSNSALALLSGRSSVTLYGTLSNAGTIKLSDAAVFVVHYAGASPVDDIRQQAKAGRLVTDSARRVGYVDQGTSLTITAALTGDINLDGLVNADDYVIFDRSFAREIANAHWTDGDVNYDGVINSDDALLLDAAFASAGNSLSPEVLANRSAVFGPAYIDHLLQMIPEPATLGCVGAAAVLGCRRRQRP